MPVSKETYQSGLTPEQFIDLMETNKEKFVENIDAANISADVKQFFSENPVSIAAIGEDWCTDVVHFLPVMIKLAREVDGVDIRVFQRDKTDLINDYLNQGEFKSIPVFVFHDSDWNELGHFIERPQKAIEEMAAESTRFQRENSHLEGVSRTYANMPDETRQAVRANSTRFRWENFDKWNDYMFEEVLDTVRSGKSAVA